MTIEMNLKHAPEEIVKTIFMSTGKDLVYGAAQELKDRDIDSNHLIVTEVEDGNGGMDVTVSCNCNDLMHMVLKMFDVHPDVYFSLMMYAERNQKELTEKYARLVFEKTKQRANSSVEDMLKEVFSDNGKKGKGDE